MLFYFATISIQFIHSNTTRSPPESNNVMQWRWISLDSDANKWMTHELTNKNVQKLCKGIRYCAKYLNPNVEPYKCLYKEGRAYAVREDIILFGEFRVRRNLVTSTLFEVWIYFIILYFWGVEKYCDINTLWSVNFLCIIIFLGCGWAWWYQCSSKWEIIYVYR